jgi:alpha-ribazole phosphatase
VHSTLPRAALAAKDLAQSLNVPLYAQKGLQERDFGSWSKWEWPQISMKLDKLRLEDRYTFAPPNGESWQQMEARLLVALKNVSSLGYDNVAIMTHAGPIRVLLPILRDRPMDSTLKLIPVLGQCFIEKYDITRL